MHRFRTRVHGTWRRTLRSIPQEPLLLVSALVIVAGTWGFVAVADEVMEGDTQVIDAWLLESLRRADDPGVPIGPAWLSEAGRDITGLGGMAVLVLVTLAVAGYLWIMRGYRMLILLITANGIGILFSLLLKQAFSRPRPDIVPHLSEVYTSSFPSGHSMMSAVVYLTLAAIVTPTIHRRRLKVYVFVCALLLIVLIGSSRVYMGVHYPTDVLAGWSAGIVWALLAWNVTRWLSRSGAVETEPPPEDPEPENSRAGQIDRRVHESRAVHATGRNEQTP